MLLKVNDGRDFCNNRLNRSDDLKNYNLSVCDTCGTEISKSHYHIPAEIKEANRIRFVHMECCSAEDLKRNLLSYAENQIRLFQDVIHLIKDTNPDKIRDFETKYGMYEEILQGVNPDRDAYTSALISELKRRMNIVK